MKVLLINGSPHEKGCTYTALREVEKTLNGEGVDTQLLWLGRQPIAGCIGCGGCAKTGRCTVHDDIVNRALEIAEGCDGYVIGSPVHYAGMAGSLKCFLDRFFWAGDHALKPGAAVVSARRSGTTATFDEINKYFTIAQMPIVASCYWNNVHGRRAADVEEDKEGMMVMRTLGRNMAWLLKSIDAGKKAGLPLPEQEERAITDFIR